MDGQKQPQIARRLPENPPSQVLEKHLLNSCPWTVLEGQLQGTGSYWWSFMPITGMICVRRFLKSLGMQFQ